MGRTGEGREVIGRRGRGAPRALSTLLALLAACAPPAPDGPGPGSRSFERWVALEDSGATSANVSVGDLDGDGHLDILLVKGRHWPLENRILLGDGPPIRTRCERAQHFARTLDLVLGTGRRANENALPARRVSGTRRVERTHDRDRGHALGIAPFRKQIIDPPRIR